jgi:hypothetical protein
MTYDILTLSSICLFLSFTPHTSYCTAIERPD